MSTYTIAVVAGDGIGPEITDWALAAIDASASAVGGFSCTYDIVDASAVQWQRTGVAITEQQFFRCRDADAIYLGAIGLPEATHEDGTEVAGDVIFKLRFDLDLFAGIRPVASFDGVPSLLTRGDGIDYVVVRENVEGLYASRGAGVSVRDELVTDTLVITRAGTEKVVRRAFELARERAEKLGRPGTVTCVDKANVLASYAFFRKVFDEVASEFPDVASDHVYVDAMTLYQVQRPQSFDVVVAENMFGDIISDLSAATVGGLGLAASGDVGHDHGLFQPAHGSAPTIAGRNVANPSAAILSASLMLEWLGTRHADARLLEAARLIERAMHEVLLDAASRTVDMGGTASTSAMGLSVVESIHRLSPSTLRAS